MTHVKQLNSIRIKNLYGGTSDEFWILLQSEIWNLHYGMLVPNNGFLGNFDAKKKTKNRMCTIRT